MSLTAKSSPFSHLPRPSSSGTIPSPSLPISATTSSSFSAGQNTAAGAVSSWLISSIHARTHLESTKHQSQITSHIPQDANPSHYMRIAQTEGPSSAEEVKLRWNRHSAAIVDGLFVRLDWVWSVPLAILSPVPREGSSGLQLMLKFESLWRIHRWYADWKTQLLETASFAREGEGCGVEGEAGFVDEVPYRQGHGVIACNTSRKWSWCQLHDVSRFICACIPSWHQRR